MPDAVAAIAASLRVTGINPVSIELRYQWQLPFAIVSSNDDSRPLRRTFATYTPSVTNPSLYRSAPFTSKQTTAKLHFAPNRFQTSAPVITDRPSNIHCISTPGSKAGFASTRRKLGIGKGIPDYPRIRRVMEKSASEIRETATGATWWKRRRRIKYIPAQEAASNYEGRIWELAELWRISSEELQTSLRCPWLDYLDQDTTPCDDAYEYLDAEIIAFEKYMESTSLEKAAAQKVTADAYRVLTSIDPTLKISAFGAWSTGLAMPVSDIDLYVGEPTTSNNDPTSPKPVERDPRNTSRPAAESRGQDPQHGEKTFLHSLNSLLTLQSRLDRNPGQRVPFIRTAHYKGRAPIIRAHHGTTHLVVQLSSGPKYNNIINNSLVLINSYLKKYPVLRPLFFVVRQLLHMRDIGRSKVHGLGFYPLFIMIVAALKLDPLHSDGDDDAARQLLHILDFYATINLSTTAISVEPAEFFPKPKWERDFKGHRPTTTTTTTTTIRARHAAAAAAAAAGRPPPFHINEPTAEILDGRETLLRDARQRDHSLMCLQDPLDAYNDLGSRMVIIHQIQATFKDLRKQMEAAIKEFEQNKDSRQGASLLARCLEGDYTAFEERREKLRAIGRRHPRRRGL